MRAGFTLIEFILTFAIAAFLLTLLFGALMQSNRLVRSTDEYIDQSQNITIAYHQLHKDISGACVPLQVYADEMLRTEKADPELEALTKDINPLKTIFVLESKDHLMQLLTFISNNPPRAYWSEHIGAPTPSIVRIVYRLKPNPETKRPSFILMRQMGTDLEFSNYSAGGSIREYPLLSNIKELKVICTKLVEEGKDEQVVKTLEKKTEWNSDELISDEKSVRYIPYGVTLTCSLWDELQETISTYVITFVIRADSRIAFTQPTPPPSPDERKQPKSMVQLSSEVANQEES